MRPVRTIILLFFASITISAAFAQQIPMTTSIPTPYGNVNHTYYVGGPMMFYGNTSISMKHEFYVLLKNDSAFTIRTNINTLKKDHNLSFKKKGKKYIVIPAETKSLSRTTVEGKQFLGIPADSCWLFKVKSGKINCYSFLAEESMEFVIAIQNGDEGPIVPLTAENVKGMMGVVSPKIEKLIERRKYAKAILLYNEGKDSDATETSSN